VSRPELRIHPEAQAELDGCAEYLEGVGRGLGRDFLLEARHLVDEILDYPESGSPYLHGTRRRIMTRFPHSLVYRLKEDQVLIVAVPHHRQRPAYWRNRR
jgi:toxin ParE1/3/4